MIIKNSYGTILSLVVASLLGSTGCGAPEPDQEAETAAEEIQGTESADEIGVLSTDSPALRALFAQAPTVTLDKLRPKEVREAVAKVASGVKTLPAGLTQLNVTVSDTQSNFALEGSQDKIRNGTTANASTPGVRSTVAILVSPAPGKIELCTAQVINRFFLLTAAHCVQAMFVNGQTSQLIVANTNRAGTLTTLYNGAALGFAEPNPRIFDRDIGLIFTNGFNTCQNTLTSCFSSSPDLPVNPLHQVFIENPPAGASLWVGVGYGSVDDTTLDAILRFGILSTSAQGYTDTGYSTAVGWTANNQSRACKGDSGGPLVRGLTMDRNFHSGVLSGGTACATTTGTKFYSGQGGTDATWVLQSVLAIRNAVGLVFDCGTNTTPPRFIGCDNNGAIF